MATQASTLYSNNIRHMMDDLTPAKDGTPVVNMEDDVIRGATVDPRRRRHLPAAAAQGRGDRRGEAEAQGRRGDPRGRRPRARLAEFRKATNRTTALLVVGTALLLLVGTVAPVSFMQHFIVFALSCFVGFYVIWNVSHALHTPLMAITNGISSIIILGALLQIGSGSVFVAILAALATLMASVNIFGGFLVTRRMLAMFQKS